MNSSNVGQHAQAAREQISPWLQKLARFGFAAKGTTYIIIGVLAVQTAIGAGGEKTDAHGALREIAGGPFGTT